ncbi:MAG: hypothetical protein QW622_02445 [Candidatus Pacearchaeota archaeon]
MRKLIFLSLLIILIPFTFAQWKIVGSTVTFDQAGYKLGINTENANASLDVNATWARISGLRVHTLIVDNQSCLGGPNNCITNWSQIGGGGGGGGVWGQSNNNIYYNAGNVGIGTTTPSKKLEVRGDAYFEGNVYAGSVGIGTTAPTDDLSIKKPSITASGISISAGRNDDYRYRIRSVDSNSYLGIGYWTTDWYPTAGTPAVAVTYTGNVGIGTTTPNQRLEVYDNTGSAFIQVYGVGDTWNFAGINLKSDENIDKEWQITHRKEAGNTNKLIISYYNGSWWFPRLTIDTAGNVGIGTTTPSKKLEVRGDAYFEGDVSAGKIIFGYEIQYNTCRSSTTCGAACSSGKNLLGGGCSTDTGKITMSLPYRGSWVCQIDSAGSITVAAICANVA